MQQLPAADIEIGGGDVERMACVLCLYAFPP